MTKKLQGQVLTATKWVALTEVLSKIMHPVVNMILARLISPEAFGVVATLTMIFSFMDMLTDAGFQKYLIQHNFKSDIDKNNYANVAFWTNLGISSFAWLLIIFFRDPIASFVGCEGLGYVLAIGCCQLLMTSFSSIQIALYKRSFDFKTLFQVRVITIFVPFVVTIPLALLGTSYWSIITGAIVVQLINAILLTRKSSFKPHFSYDFGILKNMFSFSMWTLIESISIWLTVWIDSLIISNALSSHYLGLYKTSTAMVNSIMALVTSIVVPVLFSALSRLQDQPEEFELFFLKAQKTIAMILFPMGIGIFVFRQLATQILLGDKWSEAADIIGLWALTSCVLIVFSHMSSEVYRAKGRPKLSFIAQLLHLIVLVPTCLIASSYGFETLVYARTLIRLQLLVVHIIIMHFIIKISAIKISKSVFPAFLGAMVMGGFAFQLNKLYGSALWSFVVIAFSVVVYVVVMYLQPQTKSEVKDAFQLIQHSFIKLKAKFAKMLGRGKING